MVNNTNEVYIYRALKDAVEKLNARKNTTFNSKRVVIRIDLEIHFKTKTNDITET